MVARSDSSRLVRNNLSTTHVPVISPRMYDSEDVIIILKSCDNPLLWEHGKGNAVSPILSRVKLNKG